MWGGKSHLNSGPHLVAAHLMGMEEGSIYSAHSCWQVHFFTGIKAYFFGSSVYTEDDLRHPVSWTKQLLDSWTSQEVDVVGLCGSQPVNHTNKPYIWIYMCIYILLISSILSKRKWNWNTLDISSEKVREEICLQGSDSQWSYKQGKMQQPWLLEFLQVQEMRTLQANFLLFKHFSPDVSLKLTCT